MLVKDIPKTIVDVFKDKSKSLKIDHIGNVKNYMVGHSSTENLYDWWAWIETKHPRNDFGTMVQIDIKDFNKENFSIVEVTKNIERAIEEYING